MKKKILGLLKSKTFWFNVVSGGIALVSNLQGESILSNETALTVIGVGNVVLRMLTTKPLEKK